MNRLLLVDAEVTREHRDRILTYFGALDPPIDAVYGSWAGSAVSMARAIGRVVDPRPNVDFDDSLNGDRLSRNSAEPTPANAQAVQDWLAFVEQQKKLHKRVERIAAVVRVNAFYTLVSATLSAPPALGAFQKLQISKSPDVSGLLAVDIIDNGLTWPLEEFEF